MSQSFQLFCWFNSQNQSEWFVKWVRPIWFSTDSMIWSQRFTVESVNLRTKMNPISEQIIILSLAFLWICSPNQSKWFVYKLPVVIRSNQWVELKSHISMNHSHTDSSKKIPHKIVIRSWVSVCSSHKSIEWLHKTYIQTYGPLLWYFFHKSGVFFGVLDRPTSHPL